MTEAAIGVAPEGQMWVCISCFRTAKSRSGFRDVSCSMNAVLCYEPGKSGPSGPLDGWVSVVDRAARVSQPGAAAVMPGCGRVRRWWHRRLRFLDQVLGRSSAQVRDCWRWRCPCFREAAVAALSGARRSRR